MLHRTLHSGEACRTARRPASTVARPSPQILELVVVPALARVSSADVLAASHVLSTFHADDPHTLGIHGFSLERTYQ